MKFLFTWNVNKAKLGFGIIALYTSYAGYVQLKTKYEISERARKQHYLSDVEQ